ncbi:hypothetical protein M2152_001989 [Microbacteriaceae bacterium SG_E_30_P1]|uniref:D-alanyl-D-alanine carboxypeptidase-like core domain-containing protein n=1 Tax=Antiquaquibacter oligotrophicus TaxID=2880260 RepID=A0ABT6KP74_9MICO|nr:M15 family metallopeptidase [Antiquaquibacter oligotrophicus]MDH6181807.1 hypothetical protein [Antiquaquibacter oligotrophicus]UDF12514.1 M15 family metallopeptidase [Antiquaquibacter oligotrophicus]
MSYWGYPNGEIPAEAMYAFESRGGWFYLREDAAYWWWRLRADYAATWGVLLDVTDAYRNLAEQWYYWNAYQAGWGNVAAYPGRSNHGWAIAVDIYTPSYGGSAGTPQHDWLVEHAPKYGWTWHTGKASGESWHWEFTQTPTMPADLGTTPEQAPPPPPPTEEPDMALQDGGYIVEQDKNGKFVRGAIFGPGVPGGVIVASISEGVERLQAMGNLAGVRAFNLDDGKGRRVGAPLKYVAAAEFDATVKLAGEIFTE